MKGTFCSGLLLVKFTLWEHDNTVCQKKQLTCHVTGINPFKVEINAPSISLKGVVFNIQVNSLLQKCIITVNIQLRWVMLIQYRAKCVAVFYTLISLNVWQLHWHLQKSPASDFCWIFTELSNMPKHRWVWGQRIYWFKASSRFSTSQTHKGRKILQYL